MNLPIFLRKTDKMNTATRSQTCVSSRIMAMICRPWSLLIRSFFHGMRPATDKFLTESITTASTPDTCNSVVVAFVFVVAGVIDLPLRGHRRGPPPPLPTSRHGNWWWWCFVAMAILSRGRTNAPVVALRRMRTSVRENQCRNIMVERRSVL